jgi:tetratricopeptide (TPR) repeat protein
MFRAPERGGLGLSYDNTYTRTVSEVWRDRKANCLSLTAFLVSVGKIAHLPIRYAEATNYRRWERAGSIIRADLHMVAVIPGHDLVVDFDPRVRRRSGNYALVVVPEERVRALFHCNRAAELLQEGRLNEALEQTDAALAVAPDLSVAWNTRGAVHKAAGRLAEAEESYLRARRCDERDTTAINNLEALMGEQGRAREAARYRKLALKLRQNDPYFQAFLAEEALNAGDLSEAIRRARKARRLHKAELEFFRLEARILEAQGKPDQAAKLMEKACRQIATPACVP